MWLEDSPFHPFVSGFVMTIIAFLIVCAIFYPIKSVFDIYEDNVLCDAVFAEGSYVNTVGMFGFQDSSIEPGYIKCCVEEFVDHELRERCEVLKR